MTRRELRAAWKASQWPLWFAFVFLFLAFAPVGWIHWALVLVLAPFVIGVLWIAVQCWKESYHHHLDKGD